MSRSSLFKHVEVEDDGAPGPSATVGRVPNNVVPSDVVPMDVESDEKRIQREFIQKCVDPNRKPPVLIDTFMKRCIRLAREGEYVIGDSRHYIMQIMTKVWGWRDLSKNTEFGCAYALIPLQLESRGLTIGMRQLVPVTKREADAYIRRQLDVPPRIRQHAQAQLDLIAKGGYVPPYVPLDVNMVNLNNCDPEDSEEMFNELFESQRTKRVTLGTMPVFRQYPESDANTGHTLCKMYC